MKKQKGNTPKNKINLKIVTAIIVSGLMLLSIAICIFCGVMAYKNNQSIGMEDWLMAGCALLSMFGTIFLACVSVFQSDRANMLNERIIKQNEELQKINDTQFKIANQNLFPFLHATVSKVSYESVSNYSLNKGWAYCCSRTIEKYPMAFIEVDSRWNKEENLKYKAAFEFSLWNKSAVLLSRIEIYKIAINTPLNNIVSVSWILSDGLLNVEDRITVYFNFFHDQEQFVTGKDALSFSIFLKMETITGVKVYQKIHVIAYPDEGICLTDKLSMEEISI